MVVTLSLMIVALVISVYLNVKMMFTFMKLDKLVAEELRNMFFSDEKAKNQDN